MSSTNKTISINADLFRLGKSKTRKNPSVKIPKVKPLITPSVLKNKLLKRIREHREKHAADSSTASSSSAASSSSTSAAAAFPSDLSCPPASASATAAETEDEFQESVQYLESLSSARQKQSTSTTYGNKTMRARQPVEQLVEQQQQPSASASAIQFATAPANPAAAAIHIATTPFPSPASTSSITPVADVPYGVLKGGTKPTYRTWNKTLRHPVTVPVSTDTPGSSTVIIPTLVLPTAESTMVGGSGGSVSSSSSLSSASTGSANHPMGAAVQMVPVKQIVTRKVKKTYTLGKHKGKRIVSVLVKDRATRKKIVDAQKMLRKRSIPEMKQYLKDHQLLKVGSTAPNDIVRQMYESAIMTGEIVNDNTDVLLHNITNDADSTTGGNNLDNH